MAWVARVSNRRESEEWLERRQCPTRCEPFEPDVESLGCLAQKAPRTVAWAPEVSRLTKATHAIRTNFPWPCSGHDCRREMQSVTET